MKALEKFADHAYAFMRLIAGAMLAMHGLQKLFGILSEYPQPAVGSQMWVGGVIELFGGLCVATGFQTRLAAFLCSGMMAVAYTQFHWKLQLGTGFFPIVNKGELAALYSVLFLFIACKGGAKWSLDKK